MSFELPKLDYAKSALAPIMSEETLDLHHGKHHQTYITNLNKFTEDTDMSKMNLEEIIINSSKDKSKSGIGRSTPPKSNCTRVARGPRRASGADTRLFTILQYLGPLTHQSARVHLEKVLAEADSIQSKHGAQQRMLKVSTWRLTLVFFRTSQAS